MADDQNTTQLIKYDAACLALANAKDVDEVRQIRSASAALAAYARIAKNKQLEADAATAGDPAKVKTLAAAVDAVANATS